MGIGRSKEFELKSLQSLFVWRESERENRGKFWEFGGSGKKKGRRMSRDWRSPNSRADGVTFFTNKNK